MTPNKNCLFITTSFPPLPESQTIRNVFFANGLTDIGYEVTVITSAADEGGDAMLASLLNPAVRIVRTQRTAYHRVQRAVAQLRLRPAVRRRLRSLTAVIAGKLLAPDVWAGWAGQAFARAVDVIASGPAPSVVVSSSGSFTAHIAAARLARHYGIPWIAEYGDPWFLNPLGSRWPWVRAMNGWWERGVLRSCSGMTVTTEETAALYRDWLGEEAPPAAVVPCGFYRLGDDSGICPLKRGLRIAYVGSASAGSRDLGLFMRILEDALLRQEPGARGAKLFRVIGSSSPLFEQAARTYVTFKTEFSGWVTYTDSIREMGNADALLLIGNRSTSQIPGKVYQYLASGRPVIYLSQMARGDPTERLLEAFGGVLRLKTGAPENAAQLAAFLSELELHGVAARKRANDPRFVTSYSWAALGLSFAAFVEARAA